MEEQCNTMWGTRIIYIIEFRITCVVNIAYTTRERVIFCSRNSVGTDYVLLVIH
jgi:hypothetical protein